MKNLKIEINQDVSGICTGTQNGKYVFSTHIKEYAERIADCVNALSGAEHPKEWIEHHVGNVKETSNDQTVIWGVGTIFTNSEDETGKLFRIDNIIFGDGGGVYVCRINRTPIATFEWDDVNRYFQSGHWTVIEDGTHEADYKIGDLVQIANSVLRIGDISKSSVSLHDTDADILRRRMDNVYFIRKIYSGEFKLIKKAEILSRKEKDGRIELTVEKHAPGTEIFVDLKSDEINPENLFKNRWNYSFPIFEKEDSNLIVTHDLKVAIILKNANLKYLQNVKTMTDLLTLERLLS